MEKKTNAGLLWVIVIILAVLGVVYFTSNPQSEDQVDETGPIKIGVITPLTGDAASYGTAMQRAYDLAVREINNAGGVNERQIELIYEDGKCTGTDATTAAQKLINIDEVEVILGGTCSGETLAAAELTQAARVLLISPSATSPDISDAGDLVFRTYPSDDFEASLFSQYAGEELEYNRASVISENTDFAQALRKAFVSSWVDAGHNLASDEAYNTGETDFRTLVTKIRSDNSDMVYVIPQSPAAGELILEQLQNSRVDADVFAGNTMLDRDAIAENPELYEGLYLSEVALEEENEKTSAMLSAYEERYEGAPEFAAFTAAAYDSVYLIAEAVGAGNLTGESIATYLNESINDWNGAIGTLNFDENGDAVIALELVRAQDGELVPVE